MAYILALETSSKICSVALFKDQNLLSIREEGGSYSHAEKLGIFIEEVMSEAQVEMKNISAVAVSKGPGSYTGLRIGTSTAKGICYALDVPLISVSTLQSMAYMLKNSAEFPGSVLCPMMDARRMEVYTAVFDRELKVLKDTSASIITESFMQEFMNETQVVFFGDGSEKAKDFLKNQKNVVFSDKGLPSAEGVGALSFEKFLHGDFEDVAYFEPFYLKNFIAGKPKKLL